MLFFGKQKGKIQIFKSKIQWSIVNFFSLFGNVDWGIWMVFIERQNVFHIPSTSLFHQGLSSKFQGKTKVWFLLGNCIFFKTFLRRGGNEYQWDKQYDNRILKQYISFDV